MIIWVLNYFFELRFDRVVILYSLAGKALTTITTIIKKNNIINNNENNDNGNKNN